MERKEIRQQVTLVITLNISLDGIKGKIVEIFQRFPSHGLRVHQLRDILEYEGLPLGYGEITSQLRYLCAVGLLERERGQHYDRYYLRRII